MQRNQILGAVGLTAALAGGGFLGAVLGVPAITSAQSEPSTTTIPEGDATPEGRPEGRRGPHGFGPALDVAAEAIGVTEDELRAALQDGQSMADVAREQGVEVQAVVDALVSEATTRIDEAVADGDLEADRAAELKADLPDRITDLVNGEGFGRFPGGRGFGPDGRGCDDGDAPAEDGDGTSAEGESSGSAMGA